MLRSKASTRGLMMGGTASMRLEATNCANCVPSATGAARAGDGCFCRPNGRVPPSGAPPELAAALAGRAAPLMANPPPREYDALRGYGSAGVGPVGDRRLG